jgi:2-C-methyl-D-erythritol 4-phosphate cytidylyltransferase
MGKAVALILGGENKTVTVQKIVEHIASQNDVSEEDILLIHDAVRPFVTQRLINEGIDVARQHGAACTVMETTDTIVVSQDRELLSEVPAKQTMLAQQTPQTFNLRMLQTIYENAVKQGVALNSETELVRLCIQQGSPVRLVLGEYSNMKIINPYELEVANALLAGRES